MPESMSLSAMLADAQQLLNAIEEAQASGDFESEETATVFLETFIRPALANKTDAIAYILQVELPSIAAKRKQYLEQVQDWAKQPEQQIKSLKAYLKTLWQTGVIDGDTLTGHQHRIKFSNMTKPTINVDQIVAEQDWTPEMQQAYGETRVEFKPTKANLEEALKQGKPMPPGVEVSYSARIDIRMKK